MMGMRSVRGTMLAGAAALLGGCAGNPGTAPAALPRVQVPREAAAVAPADSTGLPAVQREFRGVWVATVDNIDWPSRPGLPQDSAAAELRAIIARAQELRLNAIVLQVRPAADALYRSDLEPWSEYLTGQMGRAPDPSNPRSGWDPLADAVQQAHAAGMELHAWFNPYRAHHPSGTSPIAASHISRTNPELVRRYGPYLWMDPGEPAVRARTLAVILDVVRRYDIDGVHIDDYFYPYPETDSISRQPIDFPDEPSWTRYVQGGGRLSRADWRRENVNTLIRELYEGIHREKSWVKFGISPFGIWHPGYPAGQGTRFSQHEQLYADARRWIREGWVDYYTPQLYWAISRPDLSYPVLLRWWTEQNVHGRHMWPGNFTSRVPGEWRAEEITDQVWVTRGIPGATGNVHFSMKAFMQNPDSLNERLLRGPYREPALIPATPWLGGTVLPAPRATLRPGTGSGAFSLDIAAAPGEAPRWYVVRARRAGAWSTNVVSASTQAYADVGAPDATAPDLVVVTPVDRLGTEGESTYVRPGSP
jgi:uncharacterized lipoprotein YddW (UPF0748 family)